MELKDKRILVTGGGSGMGRELILTLLEKGCYVIAVDINEDGLKETYRLTGSHKRFTYAVTDSADTRAVNCLANNILSCSDIDGVINNAGIIQPFLHTEFIAHDVAKRIFNVNFWGTLNMIQSFLPHLKKRPNAMLVNVSSMGGFLPIPGQSIYGASKAAVKMLSESLNIELRSTNVKVITVFPGAMNTDIKKNSEIADDATLENAKNALQPNVAARIIITAVEKENATIYIGEDSKMMRQLYEIDPERAINVISSTINHKI